LRWRGVAGSGRGRPTRGSRPALLRLRGRLRLRWLRFRRLRRDRFVRGRHEILPPVEAPAIRRGYRIPQSFRLS
jgi:hypothetical protein